jgi:hypothetical protein
MSGQLANWDYQWGQVVGQAWADEAFKQRLFADPAAALKEFGVETPAGLRVEVLQNADPAPRNTDTVMYLVLPAKPSAADLSEEELRDGTGGQGLARCGCEFCVSCERCSCEKCGCERCARCD